MTTITSWMIEKLKLLLLAFLLWLPTSFSTAFVKRRSLHRFGSERLAKLDGIAWRLTSCNYLGLAPQWPTKEQLSSLMINGPWMIGLEEDNDGYHLELGVGERSLLVKLSDKLTIASDVCLHSLSLFLSEGSSLPNCLRLWSDSISQRLSHRLIVGSLEWQLLNPHCMTVKWPSERIGTRAESDWLLNFCYGGERPLLIVSGVMKRLMKSDHHTWPVWLLGSSRIATPYTQRARRSYRLCLNWVLSWWSMVDREALREAWPCEVTIDLPRHYAAWLWVTLFIYPLTVHCESHLLREFSLLLHNDGTELPPAQVVRQVRNRRSLVTGILMYSSLTRSLSDLTVPRQLETAKTRWIKGLKGEMRGLQASLEGGRVRLTTSISY